MPTYSYACTECDHHFDIVQAFTDSSLTACPVCSGRLRKVFSSVGIVFKGSGFYRNDSRAAAESGASEKTENGDKGDATKSDAAAKADISKSDATKGDSSKGDTSNGDTSNGAGNKKGTVDAAKGDAAAKRSTTGTKPTANPSSGPAKPAATSAAGRS